MKRLAFTVLGALAGSHLLSLAGAPLYDTESDQQRNFNFFLLAWLVVAITGAWLGWRAVGPKASR